jgi:hypothetical protein
VNAASLMWAVYWADPVLARDFDVLVRCGNVGTTAGTCCGDTPAGWFRHAALSYTVTDRQGELARAACVLVAVRFAAGSPS